MANNVYDLKEGNPAPKSYTPSAGVSGGDDDDREVDVCNVAIAHIETHYEKELELPARVTTCLMSFHRLDKCD